MKRKFIIFFIGGLVGLLVSITGVCVYHFSSVSSTAKPLKDFSISFGESGRKVSTRLEREGLIRSALFFRIYSKLQGRENQIKVGHYELSPHMSLAEIVEVISSGVSKSAQITFREGINTYEMAELVATTGLVTKEEFLAYVTDPKIVAKILGGERVSLEGYLYPDTYAYTKFSTIEDLIKPMVERMKRVIQNIIRPQLQGGWTVHEVLTLASIIERETGAAFERPLISSVFHNRLQKGMRLQTDPTIIYGIAHNTGRVIRNIRKKDIQSPTKYNTYVIKGLPPGPIGNPGHASILAALKPEASSFLYFVSRNNGTHKFSKTYKEHQRAIRKFQLSRKARKGKSWRDLKGKAK